MCWQVKWWGSYPPHPLQLICSKYFRIERDWKAYTFPSGLLELKDTVTMVVGIVGKAWVRRKQTNKQKTVKIYALVLSVEVTHPEVSSPTNSSSALLPYNFTLGQLKIFLIVCYFLWLPYIGSVISDDPWQHILVISFLLLRSLVQSHIPLYLNWKSVKSLWENSLTQVVWMVLRAITPFLARTAIQRSWQQYLVNH